MDRRAWRATVHWVAKSRMGLSDQTTASTFHCVDGPHFVYRFLGPWTLSCIHLLAVVSEGGDSGPSFQKARFKAMISPRPGCSRDGKAETLTTLLSQITLPWEEAHLLLSVSTRRSDFIHWRNPTSSVRTPREERCFCLGVWVSPLWVCPGPGQARGVHQARA